MTGPLDGFRHFLERLLLGRPAATSTGAGEAEDLYEEAEARDLGPTDRHNPARGTENADHPSFRRESREGSSPREREPRASPGFDRWRGGASVDREGERDRSPAPRLAGHVMAFLNARAEETLALLLQELSRETGREVGEALEETRRAISAEIGEVREGVATSQREFSRIGREMVRSGAVLESLQAAVSSLAPAMERVGDSLRTELVEEHARERRLREEAEQAALEDILATLDGLEAGLEDGRAVVGALSEAQRRLKDPTVQRWWRAMGEATGVKRPLPEVPVSDLEGWMGGLELTHRRLQDALARRGAVPIEAAGRPFDPHLHEAVAVEPCPQEQDGLVIREERRGYHSADRIIRLSQVVVGRAAPAEMAGGKRPRPARGAEEQPVGELEAQTEGGSRWGERGEEMAVEPTDEPTPEGMISPPRDSRGRFRKREPANEHAQKEMTARDTRQ